MNYAVQVEPIAIALLKAVGSSSVTHVSSVPRELRRLSVSTFDLPYELRRLSVSTFDLPYALALSVFMECALDHIDGIADGKIPAEADHVGLVVSAALDIIAGELVEF